MRDGLAESSVSVELKHTLPTQLSGLRGSCEAVSPLKVAFKATGQANCIFAFRAQERGSRESKWRLDPCLRCESNSHRGMLIMRVAVHVYPLQDRYKQQLCLTAFPPPTTNGKVFSIRRLIVVKRSQEHALPWLEYNGKFQQPLSLPGSRFTHTFQIGR